MNICFSLVCTTLCDSLVFLPISDLYDSVVLLPVSDLCDSILRFVIVVEFHKAVHCRELHLPLEVHGDGAAFNGSIDKVVLWIPQLQTKTNSSQG